MNHLSGRKFRRWLPQDIGWVSVLLVTLMLAHPLRGAEVAVSNAADIAAKASQAHPGDTLIMTDGIWQDADILFSANGTEANPITLRAQTLGRVILIGSSRLRIAGSYLVVDGLQFTNGFRTSGDIVAFQNTTFSVANNCHLTNCAIIDYNPPDPANDTKWISLYGFSNRVENCYLKGKVNVGSTIVVWVDTQPDRPNYHYIGANYFGPRPALTAASNGGETIRVGTSEVSLNLSRSTVENNYFEQCNGDVEIISSKSCENIYRHNTFVDCEGALSLRHGNRCVVEANYFFGHGKPLTGGVRIVGEDHTVFNNYFSDLGGNAARSPLSIMQGLVNSPLNGYFQVQRATVAFNTFVNCTNTLLIGLVGTLTGSTETTTLPPVDCTIANNLVLGRGSKLVDQRITPVNMLWEGNIMFGTGLGIATNSGISLVDPKLAFGSDGLWRPALDSPALGNAQGVYSFVTSDMEGQPRPAARDIGADQQSVAPILNRPLTAAQVGPLWMRTLSTVVNWATPAAITYGTSLSTTQLNATANVPGTYTYTPPVGTVLNTGNSQTLSLVFRPTDAINFNSVTQTVTIDVLPATPAITWPTPTNITYGTVLGPAQLSATSSVPGSPVFAPPAGTVLNAANGQVLSVTFTPNDQANYTVVSKTVTINVLQARPVISWPNPPNMTFGTALDTTQLNASANVPGIFIYTPPPATVLTPGSGQLLSVTFTPNDSINYVTVTQTVAINVTSEGRLIPNLSWARPADIVFGTALGPVQLNATANVPGTFVYTPPPGTLLGPGNGQLLSVIFTPTDTLNYTGAVRTVTINVAAAANSAEVRVAYVIPTNRVAQSAGVTSLRNALLLYQSWFRDQMEQNGFGRKTFALQMEADGVTPQIHTVQVAETDSYLREDIWGGRIIDAARAAGLPVGTPGEIWCLIPETHLENSDGSMIGEFDIGYSYGGSLNDPGWAIFGSDSLALAAPAYLTNNTSYDGLIIPEIGPYQLRQGISFSWFEGTTLSSVSSSALGAGLREIIAAFGVDHDFRNDENFDGNVMGFGFRGMRGVAFPNLYPYNYTRLSYAAALALNVSPYFNPGKPVIDTVSPTVTVITSGTKAAVTGLLRITFSASDAGGLAAALLCWNRDSDRVLVDEMTLSGTNLTRTFAIPYYEAGQTNEYTVSVYDLQGNKRSAATTIVPVVGLNHASHPFIKVSPAIAGLGEDVILDASATFDPQHVTSLLEVEWDVDGDGIFDTEPTTMLVITNHYFSVGNRLIRARITDPAGDEAISAPVAVTITPCSAILSPLTRTHGFGASTGTVKVTTSDKCYWAVATTNDWITISSSSTNTGSNTVVYTVAANPLFTDRTGAITISDQSFIVMQRAFACTYSLSPTNRFHGNGASSADATIKVTTKAECSWTVVKTNDWITITSGGSGTSNGTVSYTVTANKVPNPRSGVLVIGDQLFTVNQWGTNCSYVIAPTSRAHGEGSETGLVSVTTDSKCSWSVENTNAWITINSGALGTNSGTVGYTVAANSGATTRTGVLTVAGHPVTLIQSACTFDISTASRTYTHDSATDSVSVTAGSTCDWNVINDNSWITITSGASGQGNGTVSYTVEENPGNNSRTGTLTIAGLPFTVTQTGIPCSYNLAPGFWFSDDPEEVPPTEWFHGESPDIGVIDVGTASECPWDVVNTNDWISILWTTGGFGDGSVVYQVDRNLGPARTGTLLIKGLPFTLHQERGLRLIQVGDLVLASGQTNCVPVQLEVHGTGNSVSFSLCYDTNLVAFSMARLGAGASDGTLNIDTSRVALGQVGFSVALPPGWALQPGTQTVVEVCFRGATLVGNWSGDLLLCDQPTARQVLSVISEPVPLAFADGTVKVIGACSLGLALDAPQFVWNSGGGAPWVCQTNLTHDGEDAAGSGAIADGLDSWMETTMIGPGTLGFWWKVSSEPSNDRLRLYLDGSEQFRISGEVDWEWRTLTVPSGSHVIRWRYSKNSSVSVGQDRAWVDQVQLTPSAPTITSQPASQNVGAGATVGFSVAVTGTPPLAYQWRFNGINLVDGGSVRGATTASLTLSNVQLANVGSYSVVANNAVGNVTSSDALLAVTPFISLAEALDATNLVWTTNGSPFWTGQSAITHDGVDAAQSGAVPDSGSASIQTTVTGPGLVSFWWKVSSETNKDLLQFFVGSSNPTNISGEVDWQQQTLSVPSGSQVLKWTYKKSSSTAVGQDRAWVDQVRYGPLPPGITGQPLNQSVDAGATVNFTVAATGTPPLGYRWQMNGVDLLDGPGVSGSTNATLILSNVQPAQSGPYTVVVSNGAGSVISSNALLIVSPILPLAQALDTTNLTWVTSGNLPWVGQTLVTHDGEDAARSGAITDSQTTSLQTTVNGPGTVSFWWKVSSESGNDRLRFYVAGSQQAEISGEVGWTWRSFAISSGSQLLEWRYAKNSSVSTGQDRAWVDQVLYISNGLPVAPVIAIHPLSQSVVAPGTVSLSVGAAGSTPLSYQWQFNGTNLINGGGVSGATTTNLTLSSVQAAQAGIYSVVATNAAGSAISSNALLTVITAPMITNQPVSQSVVVGATVNFSVAAIGTATLGYQWRFYGTNLISAGNVSGATSATLKLSSAQAAQSGPYSVVVSNTAGSVTSSTVTLTVSTAPKITTQPATQVVVAGTNLTLNVAASGTPPLSYRWRLNGTNLFDGSTMSGTTTESLTVSNLQPAQAGSYSVAVSNAVGSVISSNAVLTVITPPGIAIQPISQSVGEGASVTFNIVAGGSAPLTYQWRRNGTNLVNSGSVSGATNAMLTLANTQPAQAGIYSVTVSNVAGIANSSNAVLAVAAALTLADAVDAPYLTWNTGVSAPWVAQTNVTHDGSGAARSGTISSNQNSWLETVIAGPGTVRFWWKVSSETNHDLLVFYVDDMEWTRISGEIDWRWQTFDLPAGNQTLRWVYSKDGSRTNGQDRAWLDEVTFTPIVGPVVPAITMQPISQIVDPGADVNFSVEATGTTPMSFQWRFEGADLVDGDRISGSRSPTLTLANVQEVQAGAYSVMVKNPYSLDVSSSAFLNVIPVIPLGVALDTNLVWITGGYSPWKGQTTTTYDRVDAAQSGPLANNQTNWLETTVTGPGAISFWWKVSSETNHDRLHFYIDGVERASISGEVDWQWRTFDLTNITDVLRWAYTKDATGSAGQDRGWLDQVQYGPSAPIITREPVSQTADLGATVSFNVGDTGTKPINYQWHFNGIDLVDGTNPVNRSVVSGTTLSTLYVYGVQPAQAGAYSVTVINGGGGEFSRDALLTISPGQPFAQALDTTTNIWNTGWTSGGDLPWVTQTSVTHDGVDALQSGAITNNQKTRFETTVVGPGKVVFWWKVSSQTNTGTVGLSGDTLRFYIGGIEQTRISGEVDWQFQAFNVSNGVQVLEWRYQKDSIAMAGQDRGWVDQVLFAQVLPPLLTNQPVSLTTDPGATVSFSVNPIGSPPFTYHWRHAGTNLIDGGDVSGATTPTLKLSNVQLPYAGTYSIVVSNDAGFVTSSNAILTLTPSLPLADALDTPTWVWTTSGTPPPWLGQSLVSHDGVDAARNGIIGDSASSSMQTTLSGPGTITFWWRVSSETNKDLLQFFVGSTQQASISGEVNWQQRSFSVPSGSQVLKWTYSKNASIAVGQDRGWVDQVQFTGVPVMITTQPASQSVDVGATVSFNAAATGTPPFTYQWRLNGVNLADGGSVRGSTTATLTLSNTQPAQAGSYSVLIANATGSDVSSNALLTVTPVLPLAEALDATNLIWTTSGTPVWVGQPVVTHDGVDAARSGAIADGQLCSMQTTVVGPGSVSFWWKVSSETNKDLLLFYVGSTQQAQISGEANWQQQTFTIPSGTQVLKWTYSKNSSLASGLDRGWVDQVQVAAAPATISSQPVSQSVDAGTTVSLSVTASGTPPLNYQWRLNGANLANGGSISGVTTASVTLSNVQPAQSGNYSVAINNAGGTVISANALLAVTPVLTLAEALDATDLVWTTNGTPPWIGQPLVTHDGVDAARSGAIADGQTTSMQTTVNGPGTVSFWWKVSSEPSNDRLLFYVGGTEQARISGEVDWRWQTFNISSGSQVLKWTYSKNSSTSAGQDRGWVDQVQFGLVPPALGAQPANQSVDAGATINFSVAAGGTPPLTFQWRLNGVNLVNSGGVSGATSTNLVLSNVQAAQAGTYSVVVSNAVGSVTSSGALLTVVPVLTLAEALDTTGLVWTTNGTPPWIGQPIVTHDGADAARSGAISDGQTTSMQTTVSGPGTVSFWWKVSSEPGNDSLIFYVGSTEQARISGEVDWQLRTFTVGSGSQVLKWTYSKNSSASAGQDRAWVDQVQFGPTPPTITAQPASQSVDTGATVNFNVTAGGATPLSYQWRLNGVNLVNGANINGASASTLILSNVQAAQVGSYSVVISNAAGSIISSDALLTVSPLFALAEALDTTALVWTTNGSPPWVGQAVVTHDGADAARSGAIADGQTTSMQTTVNGPGTVSFWWKVSSEPSNDRLLFYIGSTEQARISGEVDWQLLSFTVGSGSQVLKWTYSKNSSTAGGQDRGWVDQVQFISANQPVAPTITSQPFSQSVGEGAIFTLSVGAGGSAPLNYQWRFNGVDMSDGGTVSGATTASLTFSNIQPNQSGSYSVVVSNAIGTVTSSSALLSVLGLSEAVDAPAITFSMGGNASWIAQTSVTHDGVDAARSGAITDNQNTRLETWVTGPGTVSFWWKVSSEPVNDQLRFYVGAVEQARISGQVDWQFQSFGVPAGVQLLKWRYSKDASTAGGQDTAWVDQITFAAAAPLPNPIQNPVSPPLFDPGSIATPPAPIVPKIVINGNKVTLTWDASPNKTYQVLYKDSLSDADWQIVDGEVLVKWKMLDGMLVTDSVIASMEDILAGQSRFYRVVED